MNNSNMDVDQITKSTYEPEMNAQRVYLVNEYPELQMSSSFGYKNNNESLASIATIQEIRIPEIIREKDIQVVYVDKVIIQEKLIEVEKQILIPEIRIVEIEKPVYIEKIKEIYIPQTGNMPLVENKEFPQWLKFCITAQSIALVGILLINLLKH